MKRRKLSQVIAVTLAVCMLAGCVLTGCGSKSDNANKETTQSGSTLIYGSNDYTRINPAIDEHGEINLLLFDGLTAHDENNEVVPGLAESWELDDATNTYTFHLRDDVNWHDGEKFTADDVEFTIKAIMDPDNESEIASNYEDVTAINVIDDKTISFTLRDKNVAFLDYMTIGILPKHLLESKDMQTDEYFHNPIGTGPYKIQEWDEGQSITLVKNEDYYKGAPKIDTIVFKIVPDDNAKALQLKSGEINLAKVTPKDAQNFTDDDTFTVYDMKTADYRGILYNFNNEFWQRNKDAIPAISYAIDRQKMVNSVLLGEGIVAYGPLQRNKYNNENVAKLRAFDERDTAKKELQEILKDYYVDIKSILSKVHYREYQYMDKVGKKDLILMIEKEYELGRLLGKTSKEVSLELGCYLIGIYDYFQEYSKSFDVMLVMAELSDYWVDLETATLNWANKEHILYKLYNEIERALVNYRVKNERRKNFEGYLQTIKKIRGY